jgi:putative hydrolase of the HAD superfamily
MKRANGITCLFIDIGGVLLSDGWDHHSRRQAAKAFDLDFNEMEKRHHLVADAYELGKLSLREYLSGVVFHEKRPFSHAQFWGFMRARSKPYPLMIELIRQLKARRRLKIAVVSNEGRELNAYRIEKFRLREIADFFISSCFVHLRKPDADMYRLALDIAQTPPRRIVYIENTAMFVQVAEGLGIQSILHTDYRSTRDKLAALGLEKDGGAFRKPTPVN